MMTPKISPHPNRRERGAVLAIVLVVLVVMMLGAVSMLRSVDTSALLSGNLAFKRESLNRSTVGLNKAFAQFKLADFISYADSDAGCNAASTSPSCTYASKWLAMNYSPRLLATDGNGVPLVLKDTSTFDKTFNSSLIVTDSTDPNVKVRFIIERMCNDFGTADEKKCILSENFERGGSQPLDKLGSAALPMYRITVRSDGVRNSQTYAQAIVTTRVQ